MLCVLTWCASWRPPRRSYRTYYTYNRTPSDKHFKRHKVKNTSKRKRKSGPGSSRSSLETNDLRPNSTGTPFKYLKQQKSGRKWFFKKENIKNKLSVSQLSTHAYQTRRETEICEQQRIIIISRCRNSPSSIARCEQLNRFLFILFFFKFFLRTTFLKKKTRITCRKVALSCVYVHRTCLLSCLLLYVHAASAQLLLLLSADERDG